jgi:putative membrane protein
MSDPARSIWRGALAGFVGGLLAAGAMSLAHQMLPKPDAPADEGEDATVKTADAVLRGVVKRPLPEAAKPAASQIVHYAFGGSMGAMYGAVAELVPRVSTGLGVPFGLAVWLGAHAITVPALGLADSPARRPLANEAPELGLHVV